jgi:hypothetical protein
MNWQTIKKFCFTYAIPGGAWLEDASGYRNWESETTIVKHLGAAWYRQQIARHGMFTGCWIDIA